MADETRELQTRLTGDTKDYEAALDTAESKTQAFFESIKAGYISVFADLKQGFGTLDKLAGYIKKPLQGALVPILGIKTAVNAATVALSMQGAQTERTMNSIAFVASRTGRDVREVFNMIEENVDNFSSRAEVAAGVLSLLTSELSTEQIGKFVRAVKDGAAANGYAADQIRLQAKALKQQNVNILDNIGVNMRLDVTMREYAKSVGKTTAQLNISDRTFAIYNEVMKQTGVVSGFVTSQTKNATYAFASFRSNLLQIRTIIGKALLPLYTRMGETLALFTKSIRDTLEGKGFFGRIASFIEKFSAAVGFISEAFIGSKWWMLIGQLTTALGALTGLLIRLVLSILPTFIRLINIITVALMGVVVAINLVIASIKTLMTMALLKYIYSGIAAMLGLTKATGFFASRLGKLGLVMKKVGMAFGTLFQFDFPKIIAPLIKIWKAFLGLGKGVTGGVAGMTTSFKVMGAAIKNLAKEYVIISTPLEYVRTFLRESKAWLTFATYIKTGTGALATFLRTHQILLTALKGLVSVFAFARVAVLALVKALGVLGVALVAVAKWLMIFQAIYTMIKFIGQSFDYFRGKPTEAVIELRKQITELNKEMRAFYAGVTGVALSKVGDIFMDISAYSDGVVTSLSSWKKKTAEVAEEYGVVLANTKGILGNLAFGVVNAGKLMLSIAGLAKAPDVIGWQRELGMQAEKNQLAFMKLQFTVDKFILSLTNDEKYAEAKSALSSIRDIMSGLVREGTETSYQIGSMIYTYLTEIMRTEEVKAKEQQKKTKKIYDDRAKYLEGQYAEIEATAREEYVRTLAVAETASEREAAVRTQDMNTFMNKLAKLHDAVTRFGNVTKEQVMNIKELGLDTYETLGKSLNEMKAALDELRTARALAKETGEAKYIEMLFGKPEDIKVIADLAKSQIASLREQAEAAGEAGDYEGQQKLLEQLSETISSYYETGKEYASEHADMTLEEATTLAEFQSTLRKEMEQTTKETEEAYRIRENVAENEIEEVQSLVSTVNDALKDLDGLYKNALGSLEDYIAKTQDRLAKIISDAFIASEANIKRLAKLSRLPVVSPEEARERFIKETRAGAKAVKAGEKKEVEPLREEVGQRLQEFNWAVSVERDRLQRMGLAVEEVEEKLNEFRQAKINEINMLQQSLIWWEAEKDRHVMIGDYLEEYLNKHEQLIVEIDGSAKVIKKYGDTIWAGKDKIDDLGEWALKNAKALEESALAEEASTEKFLGRTAADLLGKHLEEIGDLKNQAIYGDVKTMSVTKADKVELNADNVDVDIFGEGQKKGGIVGYAAGGKLPGYSGGDKVPAMLEPGEFVINKESAKQHHKFLSAINRSHGGVVQKSRRGGLIQSLQAGGEVQSTAIVEGIKTVALAISQAILTLIKGEKPPELAQQIPQIGVKPVERSEEFKQLIKNAQDATIAINEYGEAHGAGLKKIEDLKRKYNELNKTGLELEKELTEAEQAGDKDRQKNTRAYMLDLALQMSVVDREIVAINTRRDVHEKTTQAIGTNLQTEYQQRVANVENEVLLAERSLEIAEASGQEINLMKEDLEIQHSEKLLEIYEERKRELESIGQSTVEINKTIMAETLKLEEQKHDKSVKIARKETEEKKKQQEDFMEFSKNVGDKVTQMAEIWGTAIGEKASGVTDAFQKMAGNMVTLIADALIGALKAYAVANLFINPVFAAAALVGVIGLSAAKAAALADINAVPTGGLQMGGVVTHPTTAMIAEKEPEAVIPLSKLPSIMKEAGAMGSMNINLTLASDMMVVDEHSADKITKDIIAPRIMSALKNRY